VHGVSSEALDIDAMIEEDIDTILKTYSFVSVLSGLNNNSIFNGFLAAEPKNEVIYHALKSMYLVDKEVLAKEYFFSNRILKELLDSVETKDINSYSKNYKLYNEIVHRKVGITINDENKKIITHYYEDKIINYDGSVKQKPPKNKVNIGLTINLPENIAGKFSNGSKKQKPPKDKLKIGITLNLPENIARMFSNGITQNTLYLNELLLNIGYDSYFITTSGNNSTKDVIENLFYDNRFKMVDEYEILAFDFDIVIILGIELPEIIIKQLRNMHVKIIMYQCGNTYILESERILYDRKNNIIRTYDVENEYQLYDKIWSIPQMYNTNKYYWETIYRCECIEVPFVWSNNAIILSQRIGTEKDFLYKKKAEIKNIAILEPNMSIMKSAFPPLLICENSYRSEKKKLINHVFINNVYDNAGKTVINESGLNEFISRLDLQKDKKLSIEERYNTLFFMSNFADIVVSHQWENNLNYLYLDLAWMGWPIIHNGSLCKDIGYYYEGFNYKMGGEILNMVLEDHDKNAEEYIKRNRELIDRYLPSNKELQEKYASLIDSLFD
jgi:hypothetical protein